jgi:hypothetical protein
MPASVLRLAASQLLRPRLQAHCLWPQQACSRQGPRSPPPTPPTSLSGATGTLLEGHCPGCNLLVYLLCLCHGLTMLWSTSHADMPRIASFYTTTNNYNTCAPPTASTRPTPPLRSSPAAHLPALAKPTVAARFCPLLYELRPDSPPGPLQLPYRMLFAVATTDSVLVYDTQVGGGAWVHRQPVLRCCGIALLASLRVVPKVIFRLHACSMLVPAQQSAARHSTAHPHQHCTAIKLALHLLRRLPPCHLPRRPCSLSCCWARCTTPTSPT